MRKIILVFVAAFVASACGPGAPQGVRHGLQGPIPNVDLPVETAPYSPTSF